MKKICFATNNPGKLEEIRAIFKGHIDILSLKDIGCYDELPETHETLEENALEKAQYVHDKYQIDVFADDTGLEVETLNGRPGVYSARYAGPEKDANNNMDLLLKELKGEPNRNAAFKTIISFVSNKGVESFEGKLYGSISLKKSGAKGFGYDPIFIAKNSSVTLAEISAEEKNTISHRGIATRKLIEFLKENYI